MIAADGSDDEILQASSFRARCRLPVVTWCHQGMPGSCLHLYVDMILGTYLHMMITGTGAVLARSSQPLVGLMMNMRR